MIFIGRNRVRYGYSRWGWTRRNGKGWHGGLDIEGIDDKTIFMPYYKGKKIRGKVIRSRIVTDKSNLTWEWGYYICVQLDAKQTPDTVNYLYFCHCSKLLVKVGDAVESGDALAVMGNTGNAALADPPFAHVHFEVRATATGKGQDPTAYAEIPNVAGTYGTAPVQGGATQPTTPTVSGGTVKARGIDISKHQGAISDASWASIKEKCQFVIARYGYRGYGNGQLMVDEQFAANYAKCKALAIPFGVYFFSQATNAAEGKAEADMIVDKLDLASLDYFVAFDTELANNGAGRADKISVNARTEAAKAFCEEIKVRGGIPAIYASTSWLQNQLDMDLLPYDVWVADYRGSCGYKSDYVSMWQSDSKNSFGIDGFGTALDCNVCYKDYAQSHAETPQQPVQPAPTPKMQTITIGPVSAGDAMTIWKLCQDLKLGNLYSSKEM